MRVKQVEVSKREIACRRRSEILAPDILEGRGRTVTSMRLTGGRV